MPERCSITAVSTSTLRVGVRVEFASAPCTAPRRPTAFRSTPSDRGDRTRTGDLRHPKAETGRDERRAVASSDTLTPEATRSSGSQAHAAQTCSACVRRTPPPPADDLTHIWRWRTCADPDGPGPQQVRDAPRIEHPLAARAGTRCRVLARSGTNGNVLIEFGDGHQVVAPRHAIRRYADPLTKEKRSA